MHRLLTLLLSLLIVVAIPIVAGAVTETETVSVSETGLTDFTATLQVPQHDPIDGVLLEVSLVVDAVIDGYFYYENLGTSMGGYRINENTWNFSADFQGGSLIATGETVTEPLTFVDAYDGVTDYDGPSGATVPYHGTATTTVGYLPGDADFWDFEGLGTLPLDVATNIFSSYTVYGSPTTSGLHTETTWTATVTYTYDPAVAAETKTWGEVKSLYR